jgi:hypothetical protein
VPLTPPSFPAPNWDEEAREARARDERERREPDRRRPSKRRDFPQVEDGVRYPPFGGMDSTDIRHSAADWATAPADTRPDAPVEMAEIEEGGGA